MKKHIFTITPYNTIRFWYYVQNTDSLENLKEVNSLLSSDFGRFLQFVNCWGGFDKREIEYISWELPLNLIPFLISKFEFNPDYEIQDLITYSNFKK